MQFQNVTLFSRIEPILGLPRLDSIFLSKR
jgi:hypothetical protein